MTSLFCSTFIRNQGDGALATEYSHTEFNGHNLFQNNNGTSTEVSAWIKVHLTISCNASIAFCYAKHKAYMGDFWRMSLFGVLKT